MIAGNDRPIFVVGCPRSGTTMLQVMLHSHPRIAIPPETRFLIRTYRRRLSFGDLEERENRRALARHIVRTRGHRFRDLGLNRRETIRRIVNGPPTLGSALGIVFREYAARFDAPRWGDKRPGYHRQIEWILRMFPDAQFVHLVRDPRDCVASLKRMPWWKRGVHHAVSGWAQAIDNTAAAERRRPGLVVEVQYERLVSEPETELRRLCVALGEEYDPAMAEPHRLAPVAVPKRKHWHANTRTEPSPRAVGRWREELEPWEIALCETVLGKRMARFGYEPVGAGSPGVAHLARYHRVHATRAFHGRMEQLRDRAAWRKEPNPVAARLTSAQRAAAGVPL